MQEWRNKTAARRKTETWEWSTFWTGHSGSECDLTRVRLDPPMPDITFSLQTTYWNNESPSVRTQTSRLDIHSHVLVDLILKSWTRLLSFCFFFYFGLFEKSRSICCLHWKRTCRTNSGWKSPSEPWRQPTSDTNHHGESELVCVLCVKYCPQKRFHYCVRLLKSTVSFILSHTQITLVTFSWNHPKPQSGKIEYCLGELRSHTAGGTKQATDSMLFKMVIENIWQNNKHLFMCFQAMSSYFNKGKVKKQPDFDFVPHSWCSKCPCVD